MNNNKETPRVWIGSLAAYNAGQLLGDWFDAIDAPTDSRAWVEALNERGKLGFTFKIEGTSANEVLTELAREHEEIWVSDHEAFGRWLTGECSPVEAQRIATLIDDLGDDADAAGVYVRDVLGTGYGEFSIEDFRDHYVGHYASAKEYAEESITESIDEDTLPKLFDGVSILQYVDWERVARDLGFSGMTFADDEEGGVYVFDA